MNSWNSKMWVGAHKKANFLSCWAESSQLPVKVKPLEPASRFLANLLLHLCKSEACWERGLCLLISSDRSARWGSGIFCSRGDALQFFGVKQALKEYGLNIKQAGALRNYIYFSYSVPASKSFTDITTHACYMYTCGCVGILQWIFKCTSTCHSLRPSSRHSHYNELCQETFSQTVTFMSTDTCCWLPFSRYLHVKNFTCCFL